MTRDINAEILACEQARCAALLAADVAALGDLLSERLSFSHATSASEDKTSLLEKMAAGNIVYNTLDTSETSVIDLGDSALLVSRLTATVTVGGQEKTIDNRTLSVWTREDGVWRLIAYQPTAIPK